VSAVKSDGPGVGGGGILPLERELRLARGKIDRLDWRIVGLLAKRRAVVAKVGRLKRLLGLPVEDPKREAEILGRIRDRGLAEGVKGYVEAVYRAIFRSSCVVEREE
jgi:chorismate mutase / prephenate dehydrogenase